MLSKNVEQKVRVRKNSTKIVLVIGTYLNNKT